jgi:large subunit ribosomal protein L21
VLLVGSRDFTLVGRPILPSDLVRVDATVVEKNLEKTAVSFNHDGKPTRGVTNCEHLESVALVSHGAKCRSCPSLSVRDEGSCLTASNTV